MEYNLPTITALRTLVRNNLRNSGLTVQAYAKRIGVSYGGLQKFLAGKRGGDRTTLEFARRLLGE